MAFNLEAFLGGVAEHGIDYMREEKEEQRRKQRAEDDFGITKRGIDYRYDITKKEERDAEKERIAELTQSLKNVGYTDPVIQDLLTTKSGAARALQIGEDNLKSGTFDSPDTYYTNFGGDSKIITKAGAIPQEGFHLNNDAFRTLYKPADKSFTNLNARLTHFTGMFSKEKNATKKAKYQDEINLVLKTMTAEAKAKKIDDGTDIFTQSGAQSRVTFALGLARGKLTGATLGEKANITSKLDNMFGEATSADLVAVKMLRDMHGDSSEVLTSLVNSIEKNANVALQQYATKIIRNVDNQDAEYIGKRSVDMFYQKEKSSSEVIKKLDNNGYKVGDVIQFPEIVEVDKKQEDGSIVKVKETVMRTLIYTGVPLTYATKNGNEVRSYIIGR